MNSSLTTLVLYSRLTFKTVYPLTYQQRQPASARVQRSARVFKYFIQNHEYHGLYGIQTQEYYGAIVFKLKNTMAP